MRQSFCLMGNRVDALLNSSISPWQSFPDERGGLLGESLSELRGFFFMRVFGDAENGPNVRGGEGGMVERRGRG